MQDKDGKLHLESKKNMPLEYFTVNHPKNRLIWGFHNDFAKTKVKHTQTHKHTWGMYVSSDSKGFSVFGLSAMRDWLTPWHETWPPPIKD